jgi:hypothetical protein
MKKHEKSFLLALTAVASCSLLMPSIGKGESTINSVPPTPTATQATTESPRSVLIDIAETLRRLDKASTDLVTEVSRHDEIPMQGRQVMLVDNMYSMYQPGEYQPNMIPTVDGPVLPPRKKFVDLSMEQINKLTKLLATDVASLPLTAAGGGKVADEKRAQTEVANDSVKGLEAFVVSLNEKTQGPTYDNAAIAKSAKALSQQYEGLEALRKRLQKMYDKR